MKSNARILIPVVILMITGFLFFPLQAQIYRLTENGHSLRVKTNNHQHPFEVFSGEEKPEVNRPPMLGNFSSDGDTLEFTPVGAFMPGRSYTVCHQGEILFSFRVPPATLSIAANLIAVYPTSDTLPANQLKMYLYFSTPMRENVAYKHLVLIHENGDTLSNPFLQLDPELWDSTGHRLTIWFDPGRVKRALGPNKFSGSPLEAGKKYTLVVQDSWTDQSGQKLQHAFSKSFFVQSADRSRPDIKKWKLSRPKAGTREALHIDFGEPMDQALAKNTISLIGPLKIPISGNITLSAAESRWSFRPSQEWQAGSYQIYVASRLEDLAGNNLNRLFDRDLSKGQTEQNRDYFSLTLKIKNPQE